MKLIMIVAGLLMIACGTADTAPEEDGIVYTGTVQVLAQGTRSETIVLEDLETGEIFALVGDNSRGLVRHAGDIVTVTANLTDEGWSVRPELVKLEVRDYIIETELEDPRGTSY